MLSSGQTTGFGTDPAADHTPTADNGIAGVAIGGNIPIVVTPWTYMTSPVINLSAASGSVWLEFWRVLNSDYPNFMDSKVEVWDGSMWVLLYSMTPNVLVEDMAWTLESYDVTAYKN